jgi:uncharacterized protein
MTARVMHQWRMSWLSRHAWVAFVAILACCALPLAAFAAEVPFLTGRVVDNAEILSSTTRQQVTATLKAHEDKTTNQVAVLTIRSLDGTSVDEFANTVFQSWKLGQKGKDNGVLLVISSQDRRLRIEVGYGLEGQLTDVSASRIIRNVITPRFKESNYDKGVIDGVDAIVAQLEGRGDAASAANADYVDAATSGKLVSSANGFQQPDIPWPMRILLGAFIFGIIGLFTVIGVLTPGVGWFMYFFLIPFWAMFPIAVVGLRGALVLLATYVIAYPAAKLYIRNKPWYAKAAKQLRSKGTATIGGFTISSGGSSSSSSSSSGGSGGGGSSGGGGASGSW